MYTNSWWMKWYLPQPAHIFVCLLCIAGAELLAKRVRDMRKKENSNQQISSQTKYYASYLLSRMFSENGERLQSFRSTFLACHNESWHDVDKSLTERSYLVCDTYYLSWQIGGCHKTGKGHWHDVTWTLTYDDIKSEKGKLACYLWEVLCYSI